MSQEYNTTPRRNRRNRNRPTLITATATEQSAATAEETLTAVAEEPAYEATPAPAPVETRARRLPRFFSTVGKDEQESANKEKEAEIAQARIARATRGKTASKAAEKETSMQVEVKPTRPVASNGRAGTTPARPASPFKTRYIFGMLIYVVASTFISSLELSFMTSQKLEHQLTVLNIFGFKIPISTFTLVYLATLVLILVVLAYFDFLPKGFTSSSARAAQGKARQAQSRAAQNKDTAERQEEGARNIPPPIKQGVKGTDDHLYQEYRVNQRRDKKR